MKIVSKVLKRKRTYSEETEIKSGTCLKAPSSEANAPLPTWLCSLRFQGPPQHEGIRPCNMTSTAASASQSFWDQLHAEWAQVQSSGY